MINQRFQLEIIEKLLGLVFAYCISNGRQPMIMESYMPAHEQLQHMTASITR